MNRSKTFVIRSLWRDDKAGEASFETCRKRRSRFVQRQSEIVTKTRCFVMQQRFSMDDSASRAVKGRLAGRQGLSPHEKLCRATRSLLVQRQALSLNEKP